MLWELQDFLYSFANIAYYFSVYFRSVYFSVCLHNAVNYNYNYNYLQVETPITITIAITQKSVMISN